MQIDKKTIRKFFWVAVGAIFVYWTLHETERFKLLWGNAVSIVAPFDGVVERVYVDAFQRVAAGESVVRVVTPRSTTVGFTAPENLVKMLDSPTTHFSVVFDAWPDVSFKAVIKSFARTSSDALGFPVSLRLVDVDDALYSISPGMTCVVTVAMPESDRDAVLLPLEAIYAPVGGGTSGYILTSNGTGQSPGWAYLKLNNGSIVAFFHNLFELRK